jgi:hypothetical protein
MLDAMAKILRDELVMTVFDEYKLTLPALPICCRLQFACWSVERVSVWDSRSRAAVSRTGRYCAYSTM